MFVRTLSLALIVLGVSSACIVHAVTPAQKCEQGKNKEAGKYAYCRQKVEAKFALLGDSALRGAGLLKCLDKYNQKWPVLQTKALLSGGECPTVGDQAPIQEAIDAHTTNIATALASGTLAGPGQLLTTGQTTCWDSSGSVIPCAGTGHDGDLQTGLARAYVDNGDGTITDTKTGLMWEKLSDDGSIHDQDTTYTWADAFAVKVAALNGGGGFASYTDWRVPNRSELESLVNLGALSPAVSPAFNTGCAPACTVLTCSCTQTFRYWSSSTYQDAPQGAWYVVFYDGDVGLDGKTDTRFVRAVRGGS